MEMRVRHIALLGVSVMGLASFHTAAPAQTQERQKPADDAAQPAPPPPIRVVPDAPPPMQILPPRAPPPMLVAPPPPPPPPRPSRARGAAARDVAEWAGLIQQNYPVEALRAEIEGSVGVRVEVNAIGQVTRCQVTASSGSVLLDEAACAGMIRFAKFDPALDPEGRPTSGSYSTRISYLLN